MQQPEDAPALLRSLVLRRRDPHLEDLVALPADGLAAPALAKAASVVQFLVETDADRTRAFLQDAGKGSGKAGPPGKTAGEKGKESSRRPSGSERSLSRYYRDFKTWKDLDGAWRAWVLDVYRN